MCDNTGTRMRTRARTCLLAAVLCLAPRFAVVFTQDRSVVASADEAKPVGRFEVTRATDEAKLRHLLAPGHRLHVRSPAA